MKFVPVVLSALLVGAHFFRTGNIALAILPLSMLMLLFLRNAWVRLVFPYLLLVAGLFWVSVAIDFSMIRRALGIPFLRMAIIIGVVSVFSASSALVFSSERFKRRYSLHSGSAVHSAAAFALAAVLLSTVHLKVSMSMLLAERFVEGGGWIEIFALSTYAAWIVQKMMDPSSAPAWRRRLWLVFSVVFFGQAIIGVAGVSKLLMTGTLHVPVPAVIVAGPLFRGDGFFMPILFISTMVLVGPAWCSYLCYFGSFDQLASDRKKISRDLPSWKTPVRIGILILTVGVAVGLKLMNVPGFVAAAVALAFGFLGVGVMLTLSRKMGVMVHCVVFCPIGVLADYLGKISPFRLRFKRDCDGCGACGLSCSYGALTKADIEKRKVGATCTLCGDCIGKCKSSQLEYRFASLKGDRARSFFVVMIVVLHTVFLAVARI